MEKSKGLIMIMVFVVMLALGVSITSLLLLMKTKTSGSAHGEASAEKPKATLTYDVKKGEAVVANLAQDKSKKPMMLRVAVTIEYDKGGFMHKPITAELEEKDKIIESLVTDAIKSTSADEVMTKGEQAKKEFTEKLQERLQEEFGKDIYRVFTSEFIYN